MATKTIPELKTPLSFPVMEIEAKIRETLKKVAEDQTLLHNNPSNETGGCPTFGPQPVIDSLIIVEVLIETEELVPFSIPESFVKPGGYNSIDEVVDDLIPKVERQWKIHYGGKN